MRLVVLVAAWTAGLLAGLEMNIQLPVLGLFSIAALIVAYLLKSRGSSAWGALLVVVMLMGFLRVEVSETSDPLKPSNGLQEITVRGLVVSDPEVSGPGVEFIVFVEAIHLADEWKEGSGKVLVFARPPAELVQIREEPYFRYGDKLGLAGRLEKPPALGDFDYRAYLANQRIHTTMPYPQVKFLDEGGGSSALGFIYDARREISHGVDQALPEPQASFAQALLLGLRGRMPRDVIEDFRSSGTSHLLAISGMHVGTLLALSLGAGVWAMGRRRQLYLLLPLGAIWLYALLSGLSPSVERAAIMGTVYLLALALGRPRSVLPALALAAGVMASVEPHVLKDVSFQLSFTAVAGIALLTTSASPLWSRIFGPAAGGGWWRNTVVKALVLAVAVSVAATIATLPLIAFNFERIPTVGIPATVLALPALPFLLITSALAAIVGMIHSQAGQVVGWVAWVPLEYVLQMVHLFARVPGSTISLPSFSGVVVWAYYGILAILLLLPGGLPFLWKLLQRFATSWQAKVMVEGRPTATLRFPIGVYLVSGVGLAILAATLWYYVLTGPDGKLHVHFLDVGQGDSALIVTPEGRKVLVDGGPGAMGAAQAVGNKLAFWDRDLDLVVLTHPDEDHFRGLVDVLDRYDVEAVLEGGGVSDNPLYLEWEKALEGEGIRHVAAFQGQTIALDKATYLEVLNPPSRWIKGTGSELNNNGVVLRLVHGEVSFLLTADIEAAAERRLLHEGLPLSSTVMKVPHHGSQTSTTPQFLSAVRPAAAVISAGAPTTPMAIPTVTWLGGLRLPPERTGLFSHQIRATSNLLPTAKDFGLRRPVRT